MVIGPEGPLGEMSSYDARHKADSYGLDLVCVSPTANPPICKILDYGKYKFNKTKKEKEAKKRRSFVILKEVRLTPNIGDHDLKTKAARAQKFLQENLKVKVSLKFRGRERIHVDVGYGVLKKFFQEVREVADVEKKPFANGRFFDMILAPKKNTKKGRINNDENENQISPDQAD